MKENYFLCKPQKDLLLITEYINEETYYEIYYKIEDKLKLEYFSSNRKKQKEIEYKFEKNNVIQDESNIKIDAKCVFYYDDGEKLEFEIKKEFKTTEIYETKNEAFEKFDDDFVIKTINDLIENGKLYGKQEFVLNNIENIFKLIRLIEKKQIEFKDEKIEKEISLEETIKIINDFLKEIEINIDINKLIENKTIRFIEEKNKNKQGKSYYDEKQKRKIIDIVKRKDILMLAVIIHEIMHYTNQPKDGKRNTTSDFLTEAISYSFELISMDKFLKTKYREDAIYVIKNVLYSLKYCANYSYSAALSLCIYKENKKLTKENIEEIIKFENYKNEMTNFIKNKYNLAYNTWNLIGYYLAIYIYIEYKKDKSFMNKIKELNDSINTKKFSECLKIIDINNINDIFEKGLSNIDEFIDIFFTKENENFIKKY